MTHPALSPREQARRLWQQCFADSDAFVDLYFSRRYSDAIHRAVYEDGQLVSALQAVPYPVRFWGVEVKAAYVSGACTAPAHRNRGHMSHLLRSSLLRMYDEGTDLSLLIPAEPWLFGYYARFGYATAFDRSRRTVHMSASDTAGATSARTYEPHPDEAWEYLLRRSRQRSCCVLHTRDDWDIVLADLALSNGRLIGAARGGHMVGLGCAVPEADGLYFPLLEADDADARNCLLHEAGRLGLSEATYVTDTSDEAATAPLGMARILHAERLLEHYAAAHPHQSACIRLSDPLLPANNACFRWHEGRLSRTSQPQADARPCSIGELAPLLLGYRGHEGYPMMSLMLD